MRLSVNMSVCSYQQPTEHTIACCRELGSFRYLGEWTLLDSLGRSNRN